MQSEIRQYPPLECIQFFGDGEHPFRLNLKGIVALQTKAQAGIGAIYARVLSGVYYEHDLIETVRHGLIGGGMAPKEANDLIKAYGDIMPLEDWHNLAANVLTVAMHGYNSDGGEEAGKKSMAQTETDIST